jgi:hypothetical protein
LCAMWAIDEVRVEFRTEALESATRVETLRYISTHAAAEQVSSDLYPKLLVPAHLR